MDKATCQRCGRERYMNRLKEQPPRWESGFLVNPGTYVCEWGKKSCKHKAKKYRRSLREKKERNTIWCADEDLWGATLGCEGKVYPAPGGGVKCDTCPGWFCF